MSLVLSCGPSWATFFVAAGASAVESTVAVAVTLQVMLIDLRSWAYHRIVEYLMSPGLVLLWWWWPLSRYSRDGGLCCLSVQFLFLLWQRWWQHW